MIVLGVDPGARGGLCWTNGEATELTPMPYGDGSVNVAALRDWVLHLGAPDLVVIEEQTPTHGVKAMKSASTTMQNLGRLEGCVETMGWPYLRVRPQTWQKALGLTMPKRKTDKDPKKDRALLAAHKRKRKEKHIAYVQRRWPHISLLATAKSRTPHDGLADARLIAAWGQLQTT